jgi:TatD DNase family protein
MVLKIASESPHTLPAVGLHPWRVEEAPSDWRRHFLEALGQGARAVGEIGLDGHFAKASFESQCEAFTWQFNQAAERNLPVSIHCLKATDPLLRLLRQAQLPARGFHLHAYSGSAEETGPFLELGAYFSFHDGQLVPPARKAPEALQEIPLDRLLIETDAPETLPEGATQDSYLQSAYERIAALRAIDLPALSEQIDSNFHRYFLND